MYKVAVVGEKDSILGFKALGVAAYPVTNGDEAASALQEIVRDKVAIVCITEAIAQHIQPQIDELNKKLIPAVVLIPNNQGTLGLGMQQIKRNAEKAIGADILFGKEGS
ncbi:V-type ATP synthase subunit F [Dethiobacter alkaliphilus]|nr:V-type ATP synthase subunit F [Dethiobacter alkaliphilus]MCW3488862.1 V-type ATP synthase subunit F [Dethiobacter alkaliphilus]